MGLATANRVVRPKIKDRIRQALAGGKMNYASLAHLVFPEHEYPRAWNYQRNGGPPGCYMALSRALREMAGSGEICSWSCGAGPGARWASLRVTAE